MVQKTFAIVCFDLVSYTTAMLFAKSSWVCTAGDEHLDGKEDGFVDKGAGLEAAALADGSHHLPIIG
jgi:hypothetical protein